MDILFQQIRTEMKAVATQKRAASNAWFFKTGPGQYGEGDKFVGLAVPQIRQFVKTYRYIKRDTIVLFLQSPIHEERLFALLILVNQFKNGHEDVRKEIFDLYMRERTYINNWDLIDLSAPHIVGGYLSDKPKQILYDFAHSQNLWEKRIAMLSTYYFICEGKSSVALEIAEILVHDKHDLIQKAVGWMLREIGKRCNKNDAVQFLEKYAATMPRTMLRYALEHFSTSERAYFMQKKYL